MLLDIRGCIDFLFTIMIVKRFILEYAVIVKISFFVSNFIGFKNKKNNMDKAL